MAKDISFEWYMPIDRVIRDVGVNKNLMEFAAREWHKLYTPFVPYKTGMLNSNVRFSATDSTGTIEHMQKEYANKQYNGVGFNFNRTVHPLASAFWDRAAMAAGKGAALAKSMQAFVNRGGK